MVNYPFGIVMAHNGNVVRDWVDYDPRALVAVLRAYPGPYASFLPDSVGYVDPTYDPAQSSKVTEDVNLAYQVDNRNIALPNAAVILLCIMLHHHCCGILCLLTRFATLENTISK
mgnify:CR=1 FL=1